jgi:hypothetical protein
VIEKDCGCKFMVTTGIENEENNIKEVTPQVMKKVRDI